MPGIPPVPWERVPWGRVPPPSTEEAVAESRGAAEVQDSPATSLCPLSRQSPGCHRSRCPRRSQGPVRVPWRGRMEPGNLHGKSPSGSRRRGHPPRHVTHPPNVTYPPQGPHRGVGTGPLAAHSRTRTPRRCWSCQRGRGLLETRVPGGGRALGWAHGALLGETGAVTAPPSPAPIPWGLPLPSPPWGCPCL